LPSSFGGILPRPGYTQPAHWRQLRYGLCAEFRRPGHVRVPSRARTPRRTRTRAPIAHSAIAVNVGAVSCPARRDRATFWPSAGGINPPHATHASINAAGACLPLPRVVSVPHVPLPRPCRPSIRSTPQRHTFSGRWGWGLSRSPLCQGELLRFHYGMAAFKPTPLGNYPSQTF